MHVAKMFELAGYGEADAAKSADKVMQFETALAKASLDNVAQRDPKATGSQDDLRGAAEADAALRLDRVLKAYDAKIPQAD